VPGCSFVQLLSWASIRSLPREVKISLRILERFPVKEAIHMQPPFKRIPGTDFAGELIAVARTAGGVRPSRDECCPFRICPHPNIIVTWEGGRVGACG